MTTTQHFWSVPANPGDPDLWVCLSCLKEVYRQKVPRPNCPSCQGVSTYEAFTLEAIKDWGTDELIAKAVAAQQEEAAVSAAAAATPPVESVQ